MAHALIKHAASPMVSRIRIVACRRAILFQSRPVKSHGPRVSRPGYLRSTGLSHEPIPQSANCLCRVLDIAYYPLYREFARARVPCTANAGRSQQPTAAKERQTEDGKGGAARCRHIATGGAR